jgi:hypothetical protein
MKQIFTKALTATLLLANFLTLADAQAVIWPIASNAATVSASQFSNVNQIFWSHTGDLTPPSGYTGWITKGISSFVPANAENAKWTWSSTGSNAGGYYTGAAKIIASPTASNGAAIMNSDFLDTNGSLTPAHAGLAPSPHESELISPIFDATGHSDLVIQFNQYLRRYGNYFWVQYSTNGGTTWSSKIEINTYSEFAANTSSPNTNTTATLKRVTLTGTVGTSQMRIKFVFEGEYYFWLIDDVKITSVLLLPVELTSFKGQNTEAGNQLNWRTESEANTSDFDVERSVDGQNFNKIGSIKAQGKAGSYEFLDKGPLSITTYYRLKINDLDGKSDYSKIVTLSQKAKGLMANAFPNPATDALTVVINVEKKSDVTIELKDILGRTIWQSKAENTEGSLSLPIPLTGVANGNYLLKVSNGLTTVQQKIVKN